MWPSAKRLPPKNSRVRVLVDLEKRGLVYYRAPVTRTLRVRIPRDSILVAYSEPTWLTLSCRFEDDALERRVVPPQVWSDQAYEGFALVFFRWEIGRLLEIILE
jgi:hypothetical protein